MIPNKTVEEIFQKARIEEVVGDFLVLKRRGVNMIGHCPFHNEKTPSFVVSPGKNIFKCFGCGRSGTPVGFIMEHENMAYGDALRYLAKKYNITVEEEERTPEQNEVAKQRESLLLINEFAMKHFISNLIETEYGRNVGLSYFRERGFHDVTIEKFGLGFAYPDGHNLLNEAKIKAYNIDLMKQIGLVSQSDRDFFVNRVMFPIFNLSGRVIGFGGRSLTISEKSPKYLNSIDSDIYNKSKILYGFFQGKNAIRKEDNCYLVEGYTDVISLHQAGIEIAVASSGTALTIEQAQLIKRFTDNVTILYDGDAAGIKAAQRGLDILLQQNLNVKIAVLPDGDDPDAYLKSHGAQALKDYVAQNSKDFILFKIADVAEEAKNDPIKKVSLAQDIIQSITRMPDNLKREVYVSQAAKILNIREEVLQSELTKAVRKFTDQQRLEAIREQRLDNSQQRDYTNKPAARQDTSITPPADNMPLQSILKVLIMYGNKPFEYEGEELVKDRILKDISEEMDYIEHELYLELLNEYRIRETNKENNSPEYYMNHAKSEIREMVLRWVDPGYEFSQNWIDKYQHPLQYQLMPDENYRNEYLHALDLLKMNNLNKLAEDNKNKIKEFIENGDQEGLQVQLQAQILINKERNQLANKLGMVIIPK